MRAVARFTDWFSEWVHFQGEQPFLASPPISLGVDSEIKEFAPLDSYFFSLIVDPILKVCVVQLKANRNSQKLFPFVKMTENHRCIPIHLTVKTLKIGTPEIITIIVLQLEQLDFTVQYYDQKMQTE